MLLIVSLSIIFITNNSVNEIIIMTISIMIAKVVMIKNNVNDRMIACRQKVPSFSFSYSHYSFIHLSPSLFLENKHNLNQSHHIPVTHALKRCLSLQCLCCHLRSCRPSLTGWSFLTLLRKLVVICWGQTHFTKRFIKWLQLYKLSWISFKSL